MKFGKRFAVRGLAVAGGALMLAGIGAMGASAAPLTAASLSEPKVGEVCSTTVTSVSDKDCWSGPAEGNLRVTVQAFENDADWHVTAAGGAKVFEELMSEGESHTFTLNKGETIVVQDAQGWNDIFDTNGHSLKITAVSPA